MARQSFLPKYRDQKSGWFLGTTWTIKYADLSNLIAQCIAAWPYVDLEMAVLLSTLLGSAANPTAAALTVIRRFSNAQEVVHAAAEAALNEKELRLIEALLAVVKTASNARDDLAHGLWGFWDGVTDKLIWVEAKHAVPWASRLRGMQYRKADDPEVVAIHEALLPYLFVYTRDDLREAQDLIEKAWEYIWKTVEFLGTEDVDLRDTRYDQLCREPRIREALDRPKKS